MSRLNIFLILLLAGMLAWTRIDQASTRVESTPVVPTSTAVPTPTATPSPTPIPVGKPTSILIPKLGINALIEGVGVDDGGKMNMPEDTTKAGWYTGGFRPGEKGNAVIAGHLDLVTGAPALFWNLHTLQNGDDIFVTDEFGRERHFKVTGQAVFPFDQVPLEDVFGSDSRTRLNLMTCTGWFNHATHNYSHRVIIYSELVN